MGEMSVQVADVFPGHPFAYQVASLQEVLEVVGVARAPKALVHALERATVIVWLSH
jgi:hypothetical protein